MPTTDNTKTIIDGNLAQVKTLMDVGVAQMQRSYNTAVTKHGANSTIAKAYNEALTEARNLVATIKQA